MSRHPAQLALEVKALESKGVKAIALGADASSPAAVRQAIDQARAALGPITVLHWNAASVAAGDVLTASADELRAVFDTGVTGLLTAVQSSLADLKADAASAVLVTNGGFGLFVDGVDDAVVQSKSMGLGIANAAKHKTVRLLARRLKAEGVYLGEVMVVSIVKGTAWDAGQATLEASAVGDRFWQLYQGRKETHAQIG